MKKILLSSGLVFAFVALTLTACHFSVGTSKDFNTGLKESHNGFAVRDVFLANKDGQHLKSNKVKMDSTFTIVATGVENYKLNGGKAYPGCELTLKDKTGKVLGSIPDLLADIAKNGIAPTGATTLTAMLSLHHPFVSGETYHVAARFFDKYEPKNEIKVEVDVLLQ